jgi:manganese/zinc/iron transport system substrate-binding protein
VLATTAFVADLVKRVCGEHVKVISMVGENQDPHAYEVVKGDGEKFNYADVIFANGLFLEHSGSMQYQLKHHKNVVFLGDALLEKYPERIIYVNGQIDPHIWMNVSLWSECIQFVLSKVCEIDPAHAVEYKERAEITKEEFIKEDEQIKEKMLSIPEEKRYLVTSHDAFNYFVKRYFATAKEEEDNSWRVRMQALQGLAPDEQISVMQIKEIVEHVCKYHIEVIFPESNLSSDSLEKVKEACAHRGVKIRLAKNTLYGDTLGGKGYLEMLEHNADVLESNLY